MSSEDDSMANTCSICTAYVLEGKFTFFKSRLAVHEVVHQTCSEYDASKVDESQLCDFCIHIRPSHFMTCGCFLDLVPDPAYRHIEEHTTSGPFEEHIIVIGTPLELKSRQGRCAFCRWCLEVVQTGARRQHQSVDEGETIRIDRPIIYEKVSDVQYILITYGTNGHSRTGVMIGHNKGCGKIYAETENGTSINSKQDFSAAPPVIDWAATAQWKTRCEQEHRNCGERAMGKLPRHFRLIDVAEKRIIDANNNTPSFFALSYVWGADSENEAALCQGNLSELQKSGGLNDLPQTIADAMRVCEQLDQAYLWVDRFCIVQDDKEDKYGQIGSLEAIYSRAELVIVAACGENMQSGLAGVDGKSSRGRSQIPIEVFGFTMINILEEPHNALYNTKWNDRGWTYQEAVLARRKLYFTSSELWFECAEGLQRESTSSATDKHDTSRIHRLTTYGGRGVESSGDVYEEYRHHLLQYSKRILTYPSDIYDAFRGIENVFYPEKEIIFGLPACDFSRALLWYDERGSELQERQCSDRDIVLPSWSWASLTATINVLPSFADYTGSFYCSICSWVTLAQSDKQTLRPINSFHDENFWKRLDKAWPDQNEYLRYYPNHRQVLALAWTRGCIEADVPADLFEPGSKPGQLQPSSIISAQELASRWPTIQDFWNEVNNAKHQSMDRPTPPGLDQGHLLTRTQSSVMCVEIQTSFQCFAPPSLNDSTTKTFFIRHAHTHNDDGEIVGWLLGTGEYELRGPGTPEGVADVNFIALAIGSMPHSISFGLDLERLGNNPYEPRRISALCDAGPGVIVMAVRWTGSIAHRIAIGWVTLQGWVDSKPEFRTVVLA